MKILVLSSQLYSLCHFRLDMMKDFQSAGHEVHAAAPDEDLDCVTTLKENGITFHSFTLERNGQNPLKDIAGFFSIRAMLKEVRPDLLFTYQAKTIIYGCLAGKTLGIKRIYALIAGLGSVLRKYKGEGRGRRVVRYILGLQYLIALKVPKIVFFQNHDDADVFVSHHMVDKRKIRFMNGSGVDLAHFKLTPMPKEKRFLFIGRMIGDKGIIEYLEAAAIVKQKYPQVKFDVVGYYDTNPSVIKPETLNRYFDSGIATFHGKQDDVYPFIAQSMCFVLPSYHEGIPKTVLEAMSVGRPIITTDAPGCRDTVTEGVNGYLVPVRDAVALAQRMIDILEDKDDIQQMADDSRRIACETFDVKKVNKKLIKEMGL